MFIPLFCSALLCAASFTFAASRIGPVSAYGQLQAGKNSSGQGRIYGSCSAYSTSGHEVQVKGMSLFWSIASDVGSPFWTSQIVTGLVSNMNVELVRAPMGVDEDWGDGNYFTDQTKYQALMDAVVQTAIDNDIYVIIDYHSHTAESNTSNAQTFFATMAQKWGGYNNVIFEIYNEPKGSWGDANAASYWPTLKTYATAVISTIRQYSDNLILVGTPYYDQYPNVAANSPLSDNNVAYTFHYYAGSHSTGTEGARAVTAINSGLSVFVSEWGTVNSDGDGSVAGSNSDWQSWMNTYKLSSANWSVSNKPEGASIFTTAGAWNYSTSGSWVKNNVFSTNPTSYTACSGTAISSSSAKSSSSAASSSSVKSSSSIASSSSISSSSSAKSSSSISISSSSVSSSSIAYSSSSESSSSMSSSSITSSSSESSSSFASSSSSSTSTGACIAFVNGVGDYANHCYNSGLNDMEAGVCYTQVAERGDIQYINETATDTYWWVPVDCESGITAIDNLAINALSVHISHKMLSLNVPSSTNIQVLVFSMLGNLKAKLFEGYANAGEHSYSLNSLAQGHYIIHIKGSFGEKFQTVNIK